MINMFLEIVQGKGQKHLGVRSRALHPFFILTFSPGKMYDAGVGEFYE
jgi:hypothetical protein